VRIENQGDETAQLRSRHWIITDGKRQRAGGARRRRRRRAAGAAAGRKLRVHQLVRAGDAVGNDEGNLPDGTDRGQAFEADIAPFRLALPATLN